MQFVDNWFRSKLMEIKLLLEIKQLDSRWQKHIKWLTRFGQRKHLTEQKREKILLQNSIKPSEIWVAQLDFESESHEAQLII